MKKIVYVSKSTMRFDSRVKNIAHSLATYPYQVTVLAEKLYKDLKREDGKEYRILRMPTLSGLYSSESSITLETNEIKNSIKLSARIKHTIKHFKLRIYLVVFFNRLIWNISALIELIKI